MKPYLLVLATLLSCNKNTPDTVVVPDTGTSATGGTSATDGTSATGGTRFSDDCQRAEDTLCRLSCTECKSPKGTPFGEICRRAETDNRSFCPATIATIKDCSQFNLASKACRK